MKMTKRVLIGIFLCLMVLLLNLAVIVAQEPTTEEAEPKIIPPSGRLEITFRELGEKTRRLSAHGDSSRTRFQLPGNFRVSPSGSYIDLILSHFPEEPEKPSAINIGFNGLMVSTLPLTRANSLSGTTRIILPNNSLEPGRNDLRLDLNTGASCEEAGAVIDLVIDEASTISFEYQQLPYPADLALYPFPFVENSLFDIPVTIVLPDQPSANDLSAAATIASGLGQASGGRISLSAVLASDLDPDTQANSHLIIVGKPDANLLLTDLELPLDIDQTILEPGFGVLEEIVSPWNEYRVALIVSGLDDEAVGKASIALNRDPHFLGMRGPVAIVVDLGNAANVQTATTESFTLADLGYEELVVYGTQSQDFQFNFDLPLGWSITEEPFFRLLFNHADIIIPEASVIDISFNGAPRGSALLTSENSDNGELVVLLPEHRLREGRNTLEVMVQMDLQGEGECEKQDDRRAWTVIDERSEIFLPFTVEEVRPDLALYPYPFSKVAGLNNTHIVMPEQPNSSAVNHLVQLGLSLGSNSTTSRLAIPVSFPSQLEDEVRDNSNLILLGRPTENALLAEINEDLPHPFIADSNILQPLVIDNVVFLVDPERHAGLLQIFDSPWNEDYTVLVVTGTTDDGIALTIAPLASGNRRLQGNLAVVEPSLDPTETDPNAVNIYAIDTRGQAQETTGPQTFIPGDTLSDSQEINLSEQWWR